MTTSADFQNRIANALRLYDEGLGHRQAAEAAGISSTALYRRLKKNGSIRSISETTRRQWSRLTEAERRLQVAAAHEATRGVAPSPERLARKAQTREARALQISPAEHVLAGWLRDRGEPIAHQTAIGPYNTDLVVTSTGIAVEVNGGGWHLYGEHRARLMQRSRHILDANYHLAIVWCNRHHPLTAGAADELVAWSNRLSLDPSPLRQYRVMWGNGKVLSTGTANDDKLALVPPRPGRGYRSDLFN